MTKPTEPHERLLTIREAAALLNMSLKTVNRRIKTGDLAVIRDGCLVRIRPDDLRRYIAQRRFG